MGYLGNNLATVATGAFAAVLTGLWPIFVDFAPILEFVFIMAVPITWFLTLTCWLAQKSTDYMHHSEKKNYNSVTTVKQVYTSDGKVATASEIDEAKTQLGDELTQLKDTVKLQDSEIERLRQEIANLETRVQIEELKTELANLKSLAAGK